MNAPTASVVICTYAEARFAQLQAAVASVAAQRTACAQLVIVVDHNQQLLRRARAEFTGALVLPNAGQPGLSAARNTGTGAATGDIVVFLDDDAAAEPAWLGHLLAPYADRNVLGVGGVALPVWEQAQPPWWPAEFNWVIGCSYAGQPRQRAPIRNLMGCTMSFRRAVLQEAGGFDSALGRQAAGAAGGEETELCLRLAARHRQGIFIHEPAAVVHHQVPGARGTFAYFRARCYAEGKSKAVVAQRAGAAPALASERSYASTVLPAAAARYLRCTRPGAAASAAAAGAMACGLLAAGAGFLHGRWSLRGQHRPPPQVPAALPLLLEVNQQLAAPLHLPDPLAHEHLWCLVTNAGEPVAKLKLQVDAGRPPSEAQLRELVRAQLPAGATALPATAERQPDPAACTVVVATRNRPELLAECLDSILAGTLAPKALIVVDNAPDDERTAQLLAQRATHDARLRYVREDRPGLAHAHNAALGLIGTELVAFTDDDVLADRHWLQFLERAFARHPAAMCVTGLIAPRELDTLAQQWVEGNGTYDKGLASRHFALAGPAGGHRLLPYASGACGSGANMAFRTDYLRRARGFDTALGTGTVAMGGDDLAAFHDVLAAGHTLVYEPAAIVLHPHHRDYDALRRQLYGYGAGLGAHLMRCALRDPRMLGRLARQAVPAAARARRILHPPAPDGLPPWPRDLRRAHARGLLSGPGRYLLSSYRRRRAQLAGAR